MRLPIGIFGLQAGEDVKKELQDFIAGGVAQALQRHLPRSQAEIVFKERSFAALLETISR